jgi:TP901 family phage tail tape measure protein
MNGYMRIYVEVLAAKARKELAALQGQLNTVSKAAGSGAGASAASNATAAAARDQGRASRIASALARQTAAEQVAASKMAAAAARATSAEQIAASRAAAAAYGELAAEAIASSRASAAAARTSATEQVESSRVAAAAAKAAAAEQIEAARVLAATYRTSAAEQLELSKVARAASKALAAEQIEAYRLIQAEARSTAAVQIESMRVATAEARLAATQRVEADRIAQSASKTATAERLAQIKIVAAEEKAATAAKIGQIKIVEAQANAAAAAVTRAGLAQGIGSPPQMASLTRYGTKLQSVGRQLMRNFAIPIVAVSALGMKFALDQEKAMVQVRKVYGDAADTQAYYVKQGMSATAAASATTKQFNSEINALDRSFTFLSEKYAVQKKEVMDMAGAWAAAGVSGVALAQSVDSTLRTSVIGDMSIEKTGEALIAIQAQYNLSSEELTNTLNQLNAVENATGISMEGLIQGFSRSAGVAADYGVEARFLAADLAALTPAAGSAANSGNALKTILSRLMAPTNAASDAFESMGLAINSKEWASSTAQDRLLAFADAYNKLDDNARGAVGAVVFGRYQVSRASIIMSDATKKHGYYQKALNATSTQEKANTIALTELNAVLDSQPKKLARVGIVLQNSLADIMVPLIPYIIALAQGIANLVRGFQTLPMWVQKLALILGIFLVLLPLILLYFGSLVQVIGIVAGAFGGLISVVGAVAGAIFSPIGLAVAGAILILIAFRDQFAEIFQSLGNYLTGDNALGDAIRDVVSFGIKMFYKLPDGVRGAMVATVNVIRDAALQIYEWFSYLNPWAHHSPSLVENVTTGMRAVINQFSTLGQIEKYTKSAYRTIAKFGKQTAGMSNRSQDMTENDDRKVIKKAAGSKAADTYDVLIGKLHVLERGYDKLGAAISRAERKAAKDMAPINEAIYQNGLEQKKLQLEIAQTEKQYGSFEDAASKIEALNGEIELLRGTQQDLKNSGAGSDILGFYTEQIGKLEGAKKDIKGQVNQLDDLKTKLDELQSAGNILDLQKSVEFDPVLHKIDQMKEKYDLVGDAIDAIKSKVSEVTAAANQIQTAKKNAKDARKKKADAAKSKAAGGGGGGLTEGNFPDARGDGTPTRTGKIEGLPDSLGDQTKLIDDWIDKQQKDLGNAFAHINPFKPLWAKIAPTFEGASSMISKGTEAISTQFDKIMDSKAVDTITSLATTLANFLAPELKKIVDAIVTSVGPAVKDIWDSLKNFGKDLKPVAEAIGYLAAFFIARFAVIAKIVLGFVSGAIGPAIKGIGVFFAGLIDMLGGAVKIIAGIVNFVVHLFTGQWGKLWGDVKLVFKGVWDMIVGIFKMAGGAIMATVGSLIGGIVGAFTSFVAILWIPIKWVIDKIIGFFSYLYDVLVGHSIVPDLINAIQYYFGLLGTLAQWVWDHVLKPVIDFFVNMAKGVADIAGGVYDKVKSAFGTLKNLGQWVWNNILVPVGTFFTNGVTGWVGIIGGTYEKVKAGLSNLKNLANWIWTEALSPAYSKFKDLITNVGDFFTNNADKITGPFKGIMNFVIKGVNKMTSGLNVVAKALPGVSFHIDPIQELAEGGRIAQRRVSSGFKTNGARAIVGEGKANHPEYVVPTDPTHRVRATSLFKSLGHDLGILDNRGVPSMDGNGIPMFALGGVLGGIRDTAKGAISKVAGGAKHAAGAVKEMARDAVAKAYKPFGSAVDGMIGKIGWDYAKDRMTGVHGEIKQWISGANDFGNDINKEVGKRWSKPLSAGSGYSIGGGIGSYKGHNGQDFPVPGGTPVHAITSGVVTSSRDIAANGGKYNGGGYGSYGRVVEIRHANGLKSLYAHNSERLVATGDQVGGGDVIARSGSTGNSSGDHLHLSIWQNGALSSPLDVLRSHGIKMKNGGIVPPTIGGTLLTAGEAGQHEAVVPLPHSWKSGDGLGGGTTIIIQGNLEFPNVKNGDDVDTFIENLKSIAKD